MSTAHLLAHSPLFGALSDGEREELARACVVQRHASGVEVFAAGAAADGFYLLVSGRVRVYKSAPDGKEQTLHLFGPGQILGEAAVFSGGAFPANAQTLEAAELVYLPRSAFVDLIARRPEVALHMLGIMSQRLMHFALQIEHLTLKDAPARLASYLLYRSQEQGGANTVELDTTKTQLANLLGTTPETLSRILTRLANEGAIEQTASKHIRLANRPFLDQLASGETRLG